MKPLVISKLSLDEKPSVIRIHIFIPLFLAIALLMSLDNANNSGSLYWNDIIFLGIVISFIQLIHEIVIIIKGRIQIYQNRIIVRWSPFKKDVFQKSEIEHVLATKSFFHLRIQGETKEIKHENLRKLDRNLLIEQLMIWEIPTSCKTFRN